MKTLRQRPKAVGETECGQAVYELKGVRMILRDNAGRFTRLVACSKCGRETGGRSVMHAADLDNAPQAVICPKCAAAPTAPEWAVRRRPSLSTTRPSTTEAGPPHRPARVTVTRGHEAMPPVLPVPPVDHFDVVWVQDAGGEALAPALAERLDARDAELRATIDDRAETLRAAVEHEAARSTAAAEMLAEVERRLTELAGRPEPAPVDLDELRAQVAPALDELQRATQALERRLGAVEATAGQTAGMAAQVAGGAEKASDELRSLRIEVSRRLDEMGRAAASSDASRIDELDARLQAVGARTAGEAASTSQRFDALERTLVEAVDGIRERAHAQSEFRVALEARVEALEAVLAGIAGADATQPTVAIDDLGRRLKELEARVGNGLPPDVASQTDLVGLRVALAHFSERLDGIQRPSVDVAPQTIDVATAESAGSTEARHRDVEAGFRRGLAGPAGSTRASGLAGLTARLEGVARKAERSLHEVADLAELHAALDTGLGSLRSEIAALRNSVKRAAGGHAGADDRPGRVTPASPVTQQSLGRARMPWNGDAAADGGDLRERRARRARLASAWRPSGRDGGRMADGDAGLQTQPAPRRG